MNLVTGGNQTRHQLSSDRSRRSCHKYSHHQLLGRGSPFIPQDKTATPDVTSPITPAGERRRQRRIARLPTGNLDGIENRRRQGAPTAAPSAASAPGPRPCSPDRATPERAHFPICGAEAVSSVISPALRASVSACGPRSPAAPAPRPDVPPRHAPDHARTPPHSSQCFDEARYRPAPRRNHPPGWIKSGSKGELTNHKGPEALTNKEQCIEQASTHGG